MKSPTSQAGYPAPEVTGFEMPSADAHSGISGKVMMVLLDTQPSRAWTSTFTKLGDAFKSEHGLDEVRLIGRNLSLIGSAEQLRRLAPEAKALVHRVSRQCMRDQVSGRERSNSAWDDDQPAPLVPTLDVGRQRDIDRVAAIPGISTVLEAVTRATGMRFAAVARVTDQRWTACAVYDLIEFGLQPGQDLLLESTICNEIRQHGQIVTFDRASSHQTFATHPTPALYGFESYISVPITLADGNLFGTLCALDPEPARIDEDTTRTLQMFARMIGQELDRAAKAGTTLI